MRKRFMAQLAAAAALALGVGAAGQYEEEWEKTMAGATGLDDVGTDVAADSMGNSYIVGWVANSSTKTSYRLRIYHPDGSTDASKLTRTWGPNNGIHKAYAVAIQEIISNPPSEVGYVNIYITGETHTSENGQDIGTLMYTYDVANDEITSANPVVERWDHQTEHGDDAGLDIGFMPASAVVVVTGRSDCGAGGLGSITVAYNEGVNFGQRWDYLFDNPGDDETVCVSQEGPLVGELIGVYVGGYTHDSDDDFLTLQLDLADGSIIKGWQFDAGDDERITAITVDRSPLWNSGQKVYVTGWTKSGTLPTNFEDPPQLIIGPNYLTVAYDSNDAGSDPMWAHIFNGSGNGADVAYGIEYLAEVKDEEDEQNPVTFQPALLVMGASKGDGTDFDYCGVLYDHANGTYLVDDEHDWSGRGVFDNDLHGPDEAFAMGIDRMPGHAYVSGRTWRVNNNVNSFDFGTVRFLRANGTVDNENNGTHAFQKFYKNGSANSADQGNALNVNMNNACGRRNPDVIVTGFCTDTSAGKNIRSMRYVDPDTANEPGD